MPTTPPPTSRGLFPAPRAERTPAFLEHDRAAARTEWKDAATLLASIHGKLQLKIPGDVQHTVNGEVAFTLPPSALPVLAQMRRDVLTQAHAEEAVEIGGLRC